MNGHPLDGFRFHIDLKPRFSDLDTFGAVNTARYFTYFEEARLDYLTRLNIFLPPSSPACLVMQKAECAYNTPVHHHHLVEVHVATAKWTRRTFSFLFRLWLPEEDLLAARGEVKVAVCNVSTRRPAEIPEEYLRVMREFETAPEEPPAGEE